MDTVQTRSVSFSRISARDGDPYYGGSVSALAVGFASKRLFHAWKRIGTTKYTKYTKEIDVEPIAPISRQARRQNSLRNRFREALSCASCISWFQILFPG